MDGAILFHGASAILEKRHFGERLYEIIFDMGRWFILNYCLKIYFVLVVVAVYTVQQSISVCSILVEGVLRNIFCDIILATDLESCLLYNGHLLSIGQFDSGVS